jgi:MarR-like DNA-binding transcriptional regulator SgrR of sgrS sRNA
MLLELPALRTLFASINRIDVTHPQCLTITLHRPDYWLPFRLASYGSVLAHPDEPTIGSGPFRLKLFSPDLVRLENHPRYHLTTR